MSVKDTHSQYQQRWLWVFLPFSLSFVPFLEAFRTGTMLGAGPDVVSSAWAMWWFKQEWTSGAWGAHSTFFNYPWGGQGAILSPLSACVWGVLDTFVGPGLATTWTAWIVLASLITGMLLLGRALEFNRLAMGSMALMMLLPRYVLFTLGETGVVGVAALPLLLGLTALVYARTERSVKWWLCVALMMGFQGVENPYLAPALPLFALVAIVLDRQWSDLQWWVLGIVHMLAIVLLFRGASGSYESLKPTGYTQVFGLYFPAIERPWARTDWVDWLTPNRILWPSGSMDSIHIQGREYLGWSGLILGVLALRMSKSYVWFALAVLGLVLVTGSDWAGYPSVFGLLNSVADVLVRPFTQPSRYFLLYAIGSGVMVGYAVQKLGKLGIVAWMALVVEAWFLGGLSLRLPTTQMPTSECLAKENMTGPVLVWPWDGADDQRFESSLQSRLFQMVHGQPGATIATGSWALEGTVFPGKRLRDIGWRKAMDGRGELDVSALYDWGYRTVIVDESSGRVVTRRARDDIFGLDNRILDCETVDVYRLRPR